MVTAAAAPLRSSARPLVMTVLGAAATAAVIGIPTDVIANPWFTRKVPVRASDVVVLIALSVVTGALAATYATSEHRAAGPGRVGLGSGILGWFAVGCPVCNKLGVALLGVSGATGVFALLQPALGALAVTLAIVALAVRLRAIRRAACPTPGLGSRPPGRAEKARTRSC